MPLGFLQKVKLTCILGCGGVVDGGVGIRAGARAKAEEGADTGGEAEADEDSWGRVGEDELESAKVNKHIC